eukprot:scaffold712_cov255-Chaetoceros_neogracile.AAC.6
MIERRFPLHACLLLIDAAAVFYIHASYLEYSPTVTILYAATSAFTHSAIHLLKLTIKLNYEYH